MNALRKSNTKKIVLGLSLMFTNFCFAENEAKLAEDPFLLEQAQKQNQKLERPWETRNPQELRVWAKKNLHHKLTAKKVIDAKAHPEWDWFRKSGLGLFLHWGLTSENSATGDAWAMVWSERKMKHKRFMQTPEEMFKVAETWNPSHYDPGKWLAAAKRAGFGYSVLTARHHDGYALWPSKYGTWDTGDHMGGRDLIKDYVEASRKNDMKVGLYYSGPNWHYNYKKRNFNFPPSKDFKLNYKHERVDKNADLISLMGSSGTAEQEESRGQVRELMSNYGPIDVMWWDGNVSMSEEELKPMQPNIFVARGNIATPEGSHQAASHNVKVTNEAAWWWETCQKSENKFTPNWHYGIECESNHWDTNKLLTELIRCRSLGGNLLVNIPPRGNGEMMPWFYTLCDEMATWMKHSREAVIDIDQGAPLPMLDKTENYTTKRGKVLYSLANDKDIIFISAITQPESVTLLRTGEALEFKFRDNSLYLKLPKSKQSSLPDLVKIVL